MGVEIRDKKGSHVGVILSFIIFITFVVFLFLILEPSITIREDKKNLLNDLEIELIHKLSGNLITLTITTEKDVNRLCIELEGLIGKEIQNITIDTHIVVQNESGDIPDYVIRGLTDDTSLFIERADNDNVFFKIYHSEQFDEIQQEEPTPSCKKLEEDKGDYSINTTSRRKEIFEEKINKTKQEYEEDYTKLRDELNIPAGSEFGFRFTNKDGIIIETEEKNISTSIYVQEIPILYIDKEANINSGFIEIKVW